MSAALSVADVARLRGVGRVAAYRWLQRNAARWLRRRGRFVVIDANRYGIISGIRPDPMSARIRELETALADLEARFNVHVGNATK